VLLLGYYVFRINGHLESRDDVSGCVVSPRRTHQAPQLTYMLASRLLFLWGPEQVFQYSFNYVAVGYQNASRIPSIITLPIYRCPFRLHPSGLTIPSPPAGLHYSTAASNSFPKSGRRRHPAVFLVLHSPCPVWSCQSCRHRRC